MNYQMRLQKVTSQSRNLLDLTFLLEDIRNEIIYWNSKFERIPEKQREEGEIIRDRLYFLQAIYKELERRIHKTSFKKLKNRKNQQKKMLSNAV